MHPDSTIYRLARDEDDYFLDLMQWGDVPRRFPTVVAERDGVIVGYLATDARPEFICAGPLYVDLPSGRSGAVIALRLLEAYEAVLRVAGVESYYFSIEKPSWRRVAERLPHTRLCRQDPNGLSFFHRNLCEAA